MRKAPLKSKPDAFVCDLEDSVPQNEKLAARGRVAEYLRTMSADVAAHSVWMVRVNSLRSNLFEDDVRAVVCPHLRCISIGKVDSVDDIQQIDNVIASVEQRAGLSKGSIMTIPWLETAKGVVNANDIIRGSNRILGVAFGLDDYLNDVEVAAESSDDRATASLHARSAVALAANANGVPAYDSPFVNFRDNAGLVKYANTARLLGMKVR